MSARLPVWIDPFRAAETRRGLAGRLDPDAMKRLAPGLADSHGQVDIEWEFGIDREKVHFVQGWIKASLRVICQRCMQPMTAMVDKPVKLAFVSSEAEMARLDPSYDPVLVENPTLSLAELVEDELLLALPMVSTHPEGACDAAVASVSGPDAEVGEVTAERENPFSILADIKKSSS